LAYFPHYVGGAEVAVKEITNRISSSKIEFDMITVGKQAFSPLRIGNINVYRVGQFWGNDSKPSNSRIGIFAKFVYIPLAFLKAIRLHHKNKYDSVWSIMASYAGSATYLFKKIFPKIPVILTIQEGENFERRSGFFGIFFRMIFRSADRIQVISSFLVEWSRSMGAKCPIEIVPNGVEFSHFSKPIDPEMRNKIRDELGVKNSEVLLVTASRLTYKNAIDDIIVALQYLDKSYKFLVLGSGEDEDTLRKTVTKMNLADRVIFKGFVNHEKLPDYLKSSNIFIRPSRSEGLGNSFLEAMAVGIPVIATRVGGIPDFLRDGETGLFCEVDNPKSIAQKVMKLTKDAESRDYIVRQAKEMIEQQYDWQTIGEKMENILYNKSI
jgi:glycosyltransferase involved in cell wall biosynthesis